MMLVPLIPLPTAVPLASAFLSTPSVFTLVALSVSSTWSARMKMLVTRVALKPCSWFEIMPQSCTRLKNSVFCIVSSAVVETEPAVPDLA